MVSNSANQVKPLFATEYFLAMGFLLLLILFIRTTNGIDLTDEMQYYGEIVGLIKTGRFFSDDLFLQQTVYLLFYPAFYIHHAIFGFEGLVFFGRLLIALVTIVVFIYSYNKLLRMNIPAPISSMTALSLTFAIPYHGLFALSYNTVSQAMWIIFAIKFFEWKPQRVISWVFIPIVTAFAHPISAIIMTALLLGRLGVEKNFIQATKVIGALMAGAFLALLLLLLGFGTLDEYFDSLRFSGGYGVGTVFFSDAKGSAAFMGICAAFFFLMAVGARLPKINPAALASIFVLTGLVLFFKDGVGTYDIKTVQALAILSGMVYLWAINNYSYDNSAQISRIHWLVLMLIVYAATIGITSGNGAGQATGAFMVALPLLLAISLAGESAQDLRKLLIGCAFVPLALFISQWSRHPYREANWWKVDQAIESVPEFKFIHTSPERAQFINEIKTRLGPFVQGRKSLVITEYPGLYFVLGGQIETCMLYMHSITSDKSEQVLMRCLEKRDPQVVLDIYAGYDYLYGNPRIKASMRAFYEGRGFHCQESSIEFGWERRLNPEAIKYRLCTRDDVR